MISLFGAQKKILVWNNDRGECKQEYPDVGRWNDGLAIVAWEDQRVGDYDIWGQFVDKDGTLLNKNFRINRTQVSKAQQNVSISCMKSEDWFVAVWQTNLYDEGDIYGQIFDRSGQPLSELYQINEINGGIQINPRVEVSTNGYFSVCWQSNKSGDWDIEAKGFSFINHTFKEESPEYTVNRQTAYNQINPDLDIYPSGKAPDIVCYA